MSVVELECGEFIDSIALTPVASPLEAALAQYKTDLTAVGNKYHVRNELFPWDFRGTPVQSPELISVIEHSRVYTRGIDATPAALSYWEVYRIMFARAFADRIAARAEEIKSRAKGRQRERMDEVGVKIKGIPLRSMHLFDDRSDSVRSMQRTIARLEIESGSTIAFSWLSTYTEERDTADRIEHVKAREHWIPGAEFSLANMRLWKNKIAITLKVVDIITVTATHHDREVDPVAAAVTFVIMNLSPGGHAIILLHDFSSTSAISYIHLFTRCFRSAKLIHTAADDKLFLAGCDYVPPPVRLLGKIAGGVESPTVSIYNSAYMETPGYISTVNSLLTVLRAISTYRVAEYDKLFRVFARINTPSSKMFNRATEKVLEEEYPTASKQWIAAVKWDI